MNLQQDLPTEGLPKLSNRKIPFIRKLIPSERYSKRERNLALLYLSPSIILLGVLVLIPMVFAFYISISRLDMVAGSFNYTFIGLDNYKRLLDDARFLPSLARTAEFTVLRVGGAFLFGLALALVMNETSLAARVLKMLFLVPWALSFVVNAIMWGWMYNTNYGVINEILLKLGFITSYHSWLGSPSTALYALTIAEAWKAIPFIALVLLAGMQAIPEELYEAAKVDGANVIKRFFFVTLPGLRPVILVSLVIQTMWSIMAFTTIWVLTQGGPLDSSMLLNIYAYQQSFMFLNLDYGAALAFVMTLLVLGLTTTYLYVIKMED